MIDILFKGKRTDNGEWVTGQLYKRSLYYGDPSVKYYIIVSTEDLGYDQALEYYEVIPDTIMPDDTPVYISAARDNSKTMYLLELYRKIFGISDDDWDDAKRAVVRRLGYPDDCLDDE